MTLELAKKDDYKDFKRLYYSAFPPEERPPYFYLKRRAKKGKGELFIAKDNGSFVGFIYLVPYLDMVYVFFFAIEESLRYKGYGSKILQLVKERNANKRLFLAREPLDENAENAEQRKGRREFYMKNGFIDLPMKIIENHYAFDAMGIGGKFSAEEYDALITNFMGKFARKFVEMRVEEL
ncbi:MAG: GNAT family N-acetyltransferase [Clostridiales bacterium]|nr:GNAT family N-acetyltransferase [Clostridiales bacterium]